MGDSRRELIGRTARGTLLAAVLFFTFAYVAKEIPGLYVHTPWQNDPYDAVVSFAIFLVPLAAGVCLLRVPLCRRYEPLPVQRARGVLRGCGVVLGCVLVTLIVDWVSVLLRADRTTWTEVTAVLIGLLTVASVVVVKVALDLRRASKQRLPTSTQDGPALDWLADLMALAAQLCRRLGPFNDYGMRVVWWLDRWVVSAIRRHPLVAAAAISLGFGAVLAAIVAIQEGAMAATLLLFFGVAACGMYAFVAVAGSCLGFVSSGRAARGGRRRVIDATVLACASVPITLAFRNSLWSIIGSGANGAGVWKLEELLLIAAASTFVLVLIAESFARAHVVDDAPSD